MSSPLGVKRRRLNGSAARLTKPFVSPLRAAKSEGPTLPVEKRHDEQAHLPSALAHTVRHSSPAIDSSIKRNVTPSGLRSAVPSPVRKQNVYTVSSKRRDPVEFQAERANTALELQIRSVKNDIDTLNQAAQISSSTTDANLEALMQKWRQASRTAAEELFGTVKERVNRMGGVAAWRESEKEKYRRSHGLGEFAEEAEKDDDADCEFDSQGEELPEEEQEYRRKEKRRAKQEAMDAAEIEEPVVDADGAEKATAVWQEPGGDDDAFTMDMMLRSLNIELNVIGYDKHAQRWSS